MKNNLSTFKVLFIVKGILNLAISLFFLAYAGFGFFFMNIFEATENNADLAFNPAVLFVIIGVVGVVLAIAFGIITLLAAKYIGQTKNYNFILVAAILNCLSGVLGILLGVFTIIELSKPEVKSLFGRS